MQLDPLKIYYYILLATDDPAAVTPFQGFSLSWRHVHWALMHLTLLPGDVTERSSDLPQVIAQRMGGVRPLCWMPLSVSALERLSMDDIGIFVVIFTGERESASRVAAWAAQQQRSVLHVSTQETQGAIGTATFNIKALQRYCVTAYEAAQGAFSAEQKAVAGPALANWSEPNLKALDLVGDGHNVLTPNHLSLLRAACSLGRGQPFIGQSEQEYTDRILESATAVRRVREDIGIHPIHFLSLLRPALILAEPALFRGNYAQMRTDRSDDGRAVGRTIRLIQSQTGLFNQSDTLVDDLTNSQTAQGVLALRQSELETFTLGLGLHAAQTTSAVVRLSPGVNRVFPALSAFARSVRSEKREARMKARRLFREIQNGLAAAVGSERLAFIADEVGPIKIVSDAPLEWLPIGNLPLSLRCDCSRINATPGNLLMSLLTEPLTLAVRPEELLKVLVVSSFEDNDPLRDVLASSLRTVSKSWAGRADIIFATAKNVGEFVAALNAYDGCILVFDGHGSANSDQPIGHLVIGEDKVDVWDLRGSVRVPPIVIISACDTHGIDASSQATVGNGFLALGARTVVATLLPVNGGSAALFIARLILRIVEFVPAAIKDRKRAISWTEIISGMQRMLLASEMLDALVGPPSGTNQPRDKIQLEANLDINVRRTPEWFANLLTRIASFKEISIERLSVAAEAIIAQSQSIRYVQLGNPDTIIVQTEEIHHRVSTMYEDGG